MKHEITHTIRINLEISSRSCDVAFTEDADSGNVETATITGFGGERLTYADITRIQSALTDAQVRMKAPDEGETSEPTETMVEIGGQVMTQSQYDAARAPLENALLADAGIADGFPTIKAARGGITFDMPPVQGVAVAEDKKGISALGTLIAQGGWLAAPHTEWGTSPTVAELLKRGAGVAVLYPGETQAVIAEKIVIALKDQSRVHIKDTLRAAKRMV